MKRRGLVNKIEEGGAIFIRHGGKHGWFQNPQTKISQPGPRHSEINEMPAKSISGSWRIQKRVYLPVGGRQLACERWSLARMVAIRKAA